MGHGGLFFKGRNPANGGTTSAQAERMAVSGTDLLWGCPQMNFMANPPFNEMRQGFVTFKKESRMAQYLPGFFENLHDCTLNRSIIQENNPVDNY